MKRHTSLILSVAFMAAALSLVSFSGCQQQNPADSASGTQPGTQNGGLDISKYNADLPVENKIKLAQALTLKPQDQSMSAVSIMFPDLVKTNVVEKDDPENLGTGQEIWYYSKDIDKTFVVKADNYSLILIFNGKEMTPEDISAAKSILKGDNNNPSISQKEAETAQQTK